jgi:hypothetical protein
MLLISAHHQGDDPPASKATAIVATICPAQLPDLFSDMVPSMRRPQAGES